MFAEIEILGSTFPLTVYHPKEFISLGLQWVREDRKSNTYLSLKLAWTDSGVASNQWSSETSEIPAFSVEYIAFPWLKERGSIVKYQLSASIYTESVCTIWSTKVDH